MRSQRLKSFGYVRRTTDAVMRQAVRVTCALGVLLLSFLALYIWSVNNTIASSLASETTVEERIAVQAEIAQMEADLLHTVGGGWSLEDRAREEGLVVFGPPQFLTREVAVARADF